MTFAHTADDLLTLPVCRWCTCDVSISYKPSPRPRMFSAGIAIAAQILVRRH